MKCSAGTPSLSSGFGFSFPRPPTLAVAATAESLLEQSALSVDHRGVTDNGPNHGIQYVVSIRRSGAIPTAFYYALSNDVESPPGALATEDFARHQCGNYDPGTNTGFISIGNLDSNLRGHEAGGIKSHWREYVKAQDDPANNLGILADRFVEQTDAQTFDTHITTALTSAEDRTKAASRNEAPLLPGGPEFNQLGQFLGFLNVSPYQPCP